MLTIAQVFRDVFTVGHWAQFQQYTSRVRLLSIGDVSSGHASVWTILTCRCLDGALLPRLECLVGYAVDSIGLCYAVLLSPTIQPEELHLKTDEAVDDGTVCMVLQAVQAVLSSIRYLHVQHIREQGRPLTIPFWSLAQLHTPRATHRLILKDEMLRSLAKFSHLHVLELNLEKVPTFVEDERVEGFASPVRVCYLMYMFVAIQHT